MNVLLKRIVPLLLLLSLSTMFLGAESTPSDTYVKVLYIEKIAPHQLGYKIEYKTSSGFINTLFVPVKWINGTKGKAELIESTSKSVPYMEVVYKKGKFSVVRLYVWPGFDHPSWTVMPAGKDWTESFNIEELAVKY